MYIVLFSGTYLFSSKFNTTGSSLYLSWTARNLLLKHFTGSVAWSTICRCALWGHLCFIRHTVMLTGWRLSIRGFLYLHWILFRYGFLVTWRWGQSRMKWTSVSGRPRHSGHWSFWLFPAMCVPDSAYHCTSSLPCLGFSHSHLNGASPTSPDWMDFSNIADGFIEVLKGLFVPAYCLTFFIQ